VEPYIYFNTAVGAGAVLILICIDYLLKYTGDHFQRRIFLGSLAAALGAVIVQLVHFNINGNPGGVAVKILYAMNSSFYIFQNITYYLIVIFLDYITIKDHSRSVRLLKIFALFMVLYIASVVLNLYLHFYFYISADNYYVRGPLYPLRLLLSYLPLGFIIVEMILRSEYFKRSQVLLTIFFAVITGLGTTLDIILRYGSLSWPCYAGGVLCLYFFVIQAETKIDSLTGIGNRFAFNEFIGALERATEEETWAFVLIDVVHLKKINSALGHQEGDNALQDMAAVIKRCIRETDFAARYGGDEFIIAAKTGHNVVKLIERIQKTMNSGNEKHMKPYILEMTHCYDVFTAGTGRSVRDFLGYVEELLYKTQAVRRSKPDPGVLDGRKKKARIKTEE
jgi:diguanylate cyclase (GGDEF)-like protein